MPEKQAVFFPTLIIAVPGTPVNPALNFFLQAVPMDCFSFFEKKFSNVRCLAITPLMISISCITFMVQSTA